MNLFNIMLPKNLTLFDALNSIYAIKIFTKFDGTP